MTPETGDPPRERIGQLRYDLATHARVLAQLVEALTEAKRFIRIWYDVENIEASDEMPALYEQSPEMKRINRALADAKKVAA